MSLIGPPLAAQSRPNPPNRRTQPRPAPGKQPAPPKQQPKKDDTPLEGTDSVQLGTELITIPFSVTDSLNRYVNNLSQNDIVVYEDGQPQQIFSFTRETDLSLKYALVIDTSNSQRNTLALEKAAAQRFFRVAMRSTDSAAVLAFQHNTTLLQNMTTDLEAITRAVARVGTETAAGQGGTALYDAIYIAADDLFTRGRGRQVLILLTDGYDFESSIEVQEAIDRAVRAEAVIYSIGIGDSFNFSGINMAGLSQLATATGGRAFFPRRDSDLDEAFRQIQSDLRQRYILSYAPNNPRRDGSFRTIRVEVKGRPDYVVRYRRGYYAPTEQ